MMVLRVGVSTHRFVSHVHASPWLLHGYKDTRGRSKPSVQHPPVEPSTSAESPASVHPIHGNLPGTCGSPSGEIMDIQPGSSAQQGETTLPQTGGSALMHSPRTGDLSIHTKAHDDPSDPSHGAALQEELGVSPARTSLYKSTYEKVLFIPRPWRKPEGWMNRDMFLLLVKVVGSFVMLNPGATQKAVLDKFIPILQPVSTLELLEVLQDIGAISKVYLRKSNKASLFSPPSVVTCSLETGPLDERTVLYESSIDLINRIAQFCEYVSREHKLEGSTKPVNT